MDFTYGQKVMALSARLRAFMEAHVYPAEARFAAEVEDNRRRGNPWVPTDVMEELKARARGEELWNLWLPQSEYGAGLTNLEYLNLYGTEITDAGLSNLEGMKKLKKLYVWQTKVTDKGIAQLRKALPGVEIIEGFEVPPAPMEKGKEKEKTKAKTKAKAKEKEKEKAKE